MTHGITRQAPIRPQGQSAATQASTLESGATPDALLGQAGRQQASALAALLEQTGVDALQSKLGESLKDIAAKTGVPLNVLQQMNPDLPAHGILPTQSEVKVPGGTQANSAASRQVGQRGNVQANHLQAMLEALLNGDPSALQALGQRAAAPQGARTPAAGAAAGLGAAGLGAAGLGGAGAGGAMPTPTPGAMPHPAVGAGGAQAGGADQIAAGGVSNQGQLKLGPGYESLNKLGGELAKRDTRFSAQTPQGRAATALALAIGGTEVYSKGTNATDFFTRRGGTGNNMQGFGQYNLAYHKNNINTPEKYTKFTADILTGKRLMPNSQGKADHAANLARAVETGRVKNGADLRNWMKQQGFGGSNWQGIDDGWRRVPGLGDQLVNFIKNGGQAQAPNA